MNVKIRKISTIMQVRNFFSNAVSFTFVLFLFTVSVLLLYINKIDKITFSNIYKLNQNGIKSDLLSNSSVNETKIAFKEYFIDNLNRFVNMSKNVLNSFVSTRPSLLGDKGVSEDQISTSK